MRRTLELGLLPGGPELFKSDFDLAFYDPRTISVALVEQHVASFFGEKLMKPRAESLWVGKNGELDPNYIAMMERSIAYWRDRGDDRAVERFSSEIEGARRAVNLITVSSKEHSEPQPVILNASDPGEFYVDEEGRKKSVTFVWIKQSTEEEGWRYNVYSLPTHYIGLERHWGILKRLSNLHATQEILQATLVDEEITANALIAFPVLLSTLANGLDGLAIELGYSGWDKVEQVAADQLALEHDAKARERRATLVGNFAARIFFAVKDRRPKEYQEALVAAMSDTLALEAGGAYLGWTVEQIEEEIDKSVRLAQALRHRLFEQPSYSSVRHLSRDLDIRLGDLSELYLHYQKITQAFHANPLAQAARATGCGGSGSRYGQSFGMKLSDFGSISIVDLRVGNLLAEQSVDVSTFVGPELESSVEPDGRYPEGVYKPGHCRACDKDRQKVWHVADGGCDCCTTCEHRLAGGE